MALLSQLLPAASPQGPGQIDLLSDLWPNQRMRPLICAFVGRMREEVAQIHRLAEAGRNELIFQKRCLDVKGSAGSYGYPQISDAAHALFELSQGSAPVEQLREQIRVLDDLCRRAFASIQKADAQQPPSADASAVAS